MRSLILGGLVVLVMSACTPPFIEDLNRAAGLTGKMTLVGTVGSVSLGSETNVRFYPTKPTAASIGDVTAQSGFVVSTGSSGVNDYLRFAHDRSSGTADLSGSQPFTATGSSPYPVTEYEVTNTTTTANVVVIDRGANAGTGAYGFYTADPSGSSLNSTTANLPMTGLPGSPNYAVSVTPQPGALDTFNFLGGSGAPSNNAVTVVSTMNGFSGATVTPLSSLGTNRQLFYMNQAGTTGYASILVSGVWICVQAETSVTLPVSNRIDALLTTGQLLSTQDGTLRVYDAAGNQIFSKPLNGLQYCYEAYVGSTPYVFFSLPMNLNQGQWAFNVYAIATSSIGDLGK